jgi:hypothetical protein
MVLLGERSKIGDQIVSQLIVSDLRAPTGRQEDRVDPRTFALKG